MNQRELEKLSNQEIKDLWQKTISEARKQQGFKQAQAQAQTDLGIDGEEYFRDPFGNIIEGKKPTPKTAGHYIDSSGYAIDLAPGETPPESGSGDSLSNWLKTVDIENDAEVREALGPELFFEETLEDAGLLLIGRLENNGWSVTVKSQDGDSYKFRLARRLSREEAIDGAIGYAKSKLAPRFKPLSEDEMRMIERMAVSNRIEAFLFYVQSRLPDDLAEKFLELGASGNELLIYQFASDQEVSELIEEAVANVFYYSNSRATEQFFEFVRENDGGRIWGFSLLDELFNRYQTSSAIDRLGQREEPTAEEIVANADSMSDEELEKTLTATRRLRSRTRP